MCTIILVTLLTLSAWNSSTTMKTVSPLQETTSSQACWNGKTKPEITSCKPNTNISCTEVDGIPHTETKQISEIPNNHFSTIGLTLVNKFCSSLHNEHPQSEVKFFFKEIDECYVKSKLKSLKTNKVIGLDNISARLLKDSADVILTSLTKISYSVEVWQSNSAF